MEVEYKRDSSFREAFLSPALSVKEGPLVGRYVVANRDIKQGETVMFAKPFLTNIKESFRKRVCANSFCLKIEDSGRLVTVCKVCGLVYYCSPECCERNKSSHMKMCGYVKKIHARKQKLGEATCVLLTALLRVWFASHNNEVDCQNKSTVTSVECDDLEIYNPDAVAAPTFSDFIQLCSHVESWSPEKLKRMEKPLTFFLSILKEGCPSQATNFKLKDIDEGNSNQREAIASSADKVSSEPIVTKCSLETAKPETVLSISSILSQNSAASTPVDILATSCTRTSASSDTCSVSINPSTPSTSATPSISVSPNNKNIAHRKSKLARLPVCALSSAMQAHLTIHTTQPKQQASAVLPSLSSDPLKSVFPPTINNVSPLPVPSYAELLGWISRIESNSFAAVCAKNREVGEQLTIGAAMFNHSCVPNAMAEDSDETSMQAIRIVTIAPVAAGEELFLSYIPVELPLSSRQNLLKTCYNFACCCVRCVQEGETKQKVTYSRSKNNHKITRLKPKMEYSLPAKRSETGPAETSLETL